MARSRKLADTLETRDYARTATFTRSHDRFMVTFDKVALKRRIKIIVYAACKLATPSLRPMIEAPPSTSYVSFPLIETPS